MGIAGGKQPLPFGHTAGAAVDIEGLALLEDHFQALRQEEEGHVEEDEDDMKGWEMDSDSDDESSEEEGWINVDDENEDLVISDSEDEDMDAETKKQKLDELEEAEKRVSTLATTKVRINIASSLREAHLNSFLDPDTCGLCFAQRASDTSSAKGR